MIPVLATSQQCVCLLLSIAAVSLTPYAATGAGPQQQQAVAYRLQQGTNSLDVDGSMMMGIFARSGGYSPAVLEALPYQAPEASAAYPNVHLTTVELPDACEQRDAAWLGQALEKFGNTQEPLPCCW